MGKSRIADLLVKIGASDYEFTSTVRRVESEAAKLSRSFTDLGKTLSISLSAPLAALAAISVKNADTQVKAEAKVKQAIEATGGAAKLSFEELASYASELQNNTIFGDENILENATAQLLSFTNIAEENFLKAQEAAMDLSTLLNGDLKSASIQLGKALNDPVAGLSALGRSGIQFADQQKDVIKFLAETNKLADAQTLILAELNRQYGGQAKAAADVGISKLNQLSNSWGDFTEKIGAAIMPALDKLAEFLAGIVDNLNEMSDVSVTVIASLGGLAASVGPALLALGALVKLLPIVQAGLSATTVAMGALKVAMTAMTGPAGIIIAAVTAAVTALGVAAAKRRKYIKDLEGLSDNEIEDKIKINSVEIQDWKDKRSEGVVSRITPIGMKHLIEDNEHLEAILAERRKKRKEAAEEEQKVADITKQAIADQAAALEETAAAAKKALETAEIEKRASEAAKAAALNREALAASMKKYNEQYASPVLSGNEVAAMPVEMKLLPSFQLADDSLPRSFAQIRDYVNNELFAWADNASGEFTKSITSVEDAIMAYQQRLIEKGWNLGEATQEATAAVTEYIANVSSLINNTIADSIAGVFEGLGTMMSGGDFGLTDMLNGILSSLGNFLTQLGSYVIQVAVVMKAFKAAIEFLAENPALAILAGGAMIALGTVLTNKVNAKAENSVPALANGGLAYGPTYAMIGDNLNAKVDPEVVAPLSKLKTMMGAGTTAQKVEITLKGGFDLSGRNLRYALKNDNYSVKLIGG